MRPMAGSGCKMTRAIRVLCSMLALIMTAACMQEDAPQPTPFATSELASPAAPTLDLPAAAPMINPLTGRAPADPGVLERRPLIIKISNAPPLVRPQAGLGAADLVFEHYAEGGLTRFSVVYYGQAPERAGSIRSARLIDHELVPMYQGLFVYSGASDGVLAVINGADYLARTYMAVRYAMPYAWRDESIDAPHNLFVNPAAIYALAAQEGHGQRPDLRGLRFDDQTPPGEAGAANLIDVRYRATRAGWVYDPARRQYLRFSDGLPHADANTGQQIAVENVVVLYASHRETDIVESQWQGVISWSLEIQLWGEGDALVFRDGRQYTARWQRPARSDMLRLVAPDDTLFTLRRGVTWFQVLPPPIQQNPAEEGVSVS